MLVVSEVIYDGVVRHGYEELDAADYRSIEVVAKGTRTRAWLRPLGGSPLAPRVVAPGAVRGRVFAVALVVALGLLAGSAPARSLPPEPPPPSGPDALVEAMYTGHMCADGLAVNTATGSATTAFDLAKGPTGHPTPSRVVELHFGTDAAGRSIAWARLAVSTNSRDRLWFDWSYFPATDDPLRWRQCGPLRVADSWDSPAAYAIDEAGRPRWFRACGQVPTEDRPKNNTSKSFCTGWRRAPTGPRPLVVTAGSWQPRRDWEIVHFDARNRVIHRSSGRCSLPSTNGQPGEYRIDYSLPPSVRDRTVTYELVTADCPVKIYDHIEGRGTGEILERGRHRLKQNPGRAASIVAYESPPR